MAVCARPIVVRARTRDVPDVAGDEVVTSTLLVSQSKLDIEDPLRIAPEVCRRVRYEFEVHVDVWRDSLSRKNSRLCVDPTRYSAEPATPRASSKTTYPHESYKHITRADEEQRKRQHYSIRNTMMRYSDIHIPRAQRK